MCLCSLLARELGKVEQTACTVRQHAAKLSARGIRSRSGGHEPK
jgi:hypothetical protein